MEKRVSKLLRSLPVRVVLVACCTALLVWGTMAGARREIGVEVDGRVVEIATLQRTLGEALEEAGITLRPGDRVQPGLTARVTRGMRARVVRAVRVRLIADGRTHLLLTPPVTVARALALAGLSLVPQDRLNLPLQSVVRENTTIRLTRVRERVEAERFEVPFSQEQCSDPELLRGRQRLVRDGVPGEGERLFRVTYVDGRATRREVIQERILRPAVNRVVAVGTMNGVYRGGRVIRFRRVLEMAATAYSSGTGSYTATGHRASYGVAAVDPRVIPLGTRLYVEGYGYATALDVGSAIRGNRIDLFFPSEAACESWGWRTVQVYVLE